MCRLQSSILPTTPVYIVREEHGAGTSTVPVKFRIRLCVTETSIPQHNKLELAPWDMIETCSMGYD